MKMLKLQIFAIEPTQKQYIYFIAKLISRMNAFVSKHCLWLHCEIKRIWNWTAPSTTFELQGI